MTNRLAKALRKLPDEALAQVTAYAEFLAYRQEISDDEPREPARKIKMGWIGSASHIQSDLDSVGLMHEASASRGDI